MSSDPPDPPPLSFNQKALWLPVPLVVATGYLVASSQGLWSDSYAQPLMILSPFAAGVFAHFLGVRAGIMPLVGGSLGAGIIVWLFLHPTAKDRLTFDNFMLSYTLWLPLTMGLGFLFICGCALTSQCVRLIGWLLRRPA